MVRKIRGFTIVEVVVVIAIIAVLLAVAIPRFSMWRAKYQLEQDTRNIASLINMARNKAFTEKLNLQVSLDGKRACIVCNQDDDYCTSKYAGEINCIDLKNSFGTVTINISSRGIIQNKQTITPVSFIEGSFSCIKVSTLRAKVGLLKGGTCEIY